MRAMNPLTIERGFTLIEMLVVVLIMGLLLGLASAIVGPDERTRLHLEAERLARLLDIAAAESRITGKAIGWTSDGTGYRFWRVRFDTGWTEILDSDELRARPLPPSMTISSLRIENLRPQAGNMRLEFTPRSAALPFFAIEMSLGAAHSLISGSAFRGIRADPPLESNDATTVH